MYNPAPFWVIWGGGGGVPPHTTKWLCETHKNEVVNIHRAKIKQLAREDIQDGA